MQTSSVLSRPYQYVSLSARRKIGLVRVRQAWVMMPLLIFPGNHSPSQGHSLSNFQNLPWSTYTNAEFIPTVCYNEMPASPNARIPDVKDQNYRRMTMESVHPYNPLVYCRTTCAQNRQLLRRDPFFLVGQLLCTALLSWNQIVNFLEEDVREYQFARSDEVKSALEQLRYNISLIDRMKSYLKDKLATIDQAGLQPMEDDLREVAQQNRDTLKKIMNGSLDDARLYLLAAKLSAILC